MGRKQKRGKAGNVAQYLTRNQAIKKLQLRLSEFRRLCILKGVHPREPRKKVKGANKTYYHVKDINWLAHEPLIDTFRSLKVHERRVRKARAKQNLSLARRLLAAKPGYKLDHLVKERYPSFTDALRDLDDPLTLVHLFATLPGEATAGIAPATVDKCRRLVLEWNAYVARTHALRKVFVSVKGFYYQASIAGADVTWLVPHQLSQVLPRDVDFTVMLTFLEFYCTLAQFVLFKLFHNLGLRYPPLLDRRLDEAAAGLAGVMRDIAGLAADAAAQAGRQQPQPQPAALEAGPPGTAGAGAVPEVVSRLGSLGKKLAALKQAAAAGGSEPDSDGELPELDSGADSGSSSGSGSGEDEAELDSEAGSSGDSEAAGSDEPEEGDSSGEGEGEGEGEGDASDEQQAGRGGDELQQQQALSLSADTPAGGQQQRGGPQQPPLDAAAGAAVAGGGLGEVDADDDAGLCAVLFSGLTFFLAREVPREPLLFMIKAFGGTAGWEGEGSPVAEADEAITHHIVDRPSQAHRFLSRAYVQPQWLFDSLNHRLLLPAELYAPGRAPPPHLSPFVDNEAEGYVPEFAARLKAMQEAARAARRAAAGVASEAAFLGDPGASSGTGGTGGGGGGSGSETAAAAAAERAYAAELAKELAAAAGAEPGSGTEAEPDADSEGEQAAGAGAGDDEAGLADIMMTRKNRKLYARINRAIQGKAERVAVLEQRKRARSGQAGGEGAGGAAGGKRKKQGAH